MTKKHLTLCATCAVLVALTGCADSVTLTDAASVSPVGFWYGLWHGLILPFSWFISLFSSDTAIYAVYNNGGWYDFGFILGVASAFGGGASSTGSK